MFLWLDSDFDGGCEFFGRRLYLVRVGVTESYKGKWHRRMP